MPPRSFANPSFALINAVLRNYQRNQETLDAEAVSHDAGKYGHPGWLLKLLKESFGENWEAGVEATTVAHRCGFG